MAALLTSEEGVPRGPWMSPSFSVGASGRTGPAQIRLPPINRFWAEAPSPLDPDPGPGMASRSWVNKGLAASELQ